MFLHKLKGDIKLPGKREVKPLDVGKIEMQLPYKRPEEPRNEELKLADILLIFRSPSGILYFMQTRNWKRPKLISVVEYPPPNLTIKCLRFNTLPTCHFIQL